MTLLIRDVQILGGAREYPDRMDIFVSGDKISAIGNFPNKKADAVIDGQGAYLSPGFIDVNTDSDHYLTLFDNPAQEDFLRQGVTTIMGGMCGGSLAPLLYGGLESLGKWTDPDRINVNWHTVGELLAILDKRPLAVNFGTLAGQATIRRAIVGETTRDLTKNELGVFARTMKAALADGAFGVSTGLAYVHARKTPYNELKLIGDLVKGMGGIYATHLRDTRRGIAGAADEAIRLAKETGVKTLISHFVPILGMGKEYEQAFSAVESSSPPADVRFDIYPSANTLRPLYTFLPEWAQVGGTATMFANVSDEWFAKRIKNDLPLYNENNFIITEAPDNDFLVGKSLAEVKRMYELDDSRDALLRLMVAMKMRGGVSYKEVAANISKKAMKSDRSFIASNAPSFSERSFDRAFRGKRLKSERSTSTFTDFLALVQDHGLMPLSDAITKLTAAPAAFFGIPQRGTIQEGNFADLTCFKGSEIRFTVVNGRVAFENGEFKNVFPGKGLRHSAERKKRQ